MMIGSSGISKTHHVLAFVLVLSLASLKHGVRTNRTSCPQVIENKQKIFWVSV